MEEIMENNVLNRGVYSLMFECESKNDLISLIVHIYLQVNDIENGSNEAGLYYSYYLNKNNHKRKLYEIAEDYFIDLKTLYRFRKKWTKLYPL